MSKDIVRRIGDYFHEIIVNIQGVRDKNGKSKMSVGKLTNKIVKHNSWRIIRRDLEELE